MNTLGYNILIFSLDDVINASHFTSQKFTSSSYFLTLNILSFELSFDDKILFKICENVKDFLSEE